jgi:hypothetical protein
VELQISPKRAQIHSAYRLKKFINPKLSNFLDQEKLKRERANTQSTEFNPSYSSQNQKIANEEIKARIEQRITRSMSSKLKEKHAAQAITIINLIIPTSEKLKLQTIVKNCIDH